VLETTAYLRYNSGYNCKKGGTMKRFVSFLIGGLVAGLVAGYLLFGKSGVTGNYVPVDQLFGGSENALVSLSRAVTGLDHIRNEIILTGLLGASFGVNISRLGRRR
jgi:steroid 5-alpha reductase family enzyme